MGGAAQPYCFVSKHLRRGLCVCVTEHNVDLRGVWWLRWRGWGIHRHDMHLLARLE